MSEVGPRRPYDERGLVDLRAMDLPSLETFIAEAPDQTPSRGKAAYQAIWHAKTADILALPGINKRLRYWLAERSFLRELTLDRQLDSSDGTRKLLWRLQDGNVVESVLIPDENRLTLCVSSQVGCAMACTFCVTGDMGLIRHLSASEITLQVFQAQRDHAGARRITNLVFMGMGEPLHNLPAMLVALRNCLHDHALNFSHRKVTVSTVGLVPKMAELAAALPVNLAVSLNATTEAQRREIMPITRRYSLASLLDACRNFPLPTGKRITFEYVMLGGFNDSLEDADRLVGLLVGIPSKVNLIPYNINPHRSFRRPSDDCVKAFQHALVTRGVQTSIRTTRGIDIAAACGQLGLAAQRGEA